MLKLFSHLSLFFFYFCYFLFFSGGINIITGIETTAFDFGTLALSNLKLLGDAHLNNNAISLTRDLPVPNSGSGRVLYSKPIRFRRSNTHFPASFSTFFSFSVTNLNPSSVGGGLAFLLSSDDETVGNAGGFLGLKGAGSAFVGVEFDTLMDVEFNDINGNHVGLDLNSVVSAQVGDLDELGIEIKTGNLVNVWIDFDGPSRLFNLSVSYSNLRPDFPFLSFRLDLERFVNDFMFVGFSGSTQGSTEIHKIEWWSFSSFFSSRFPQPAPPPTVSFNAPPTASFTGPPAPDFTVPSSSPSESEKAGESSPSSCRNQLCKRKAGAVAGVVTAGAFFLAILACLVIWVFSKRPKLITKSEQLLPNEIIKTPKEFTYKELKSATRRFNSSRIIGHGAFGTVYKGILQETGAMIAVKRCSHNDDQGKAEFLSELSIISTLRHRNLVRLQGWCQEKGEILLVYDFMRNGSLDKALYEWRIPLQWHLRRGILIGVASALAYLHQECENQVIHRDVKTSNIMLDEDFNAKLGDFGLARQIEHDKSPDATVAAGTMGYLAPEYLLTGRATEKTDVFSYGAVVLEVVSGRRPIEKERVSSSNLVDWVWSLYREGRLMGAVDVKLDGEFDEEEMRRVILVGLACSNPDPVGRPSMRCVVQMLVGEAEVPMVPRSKPCLSFSTSELLLSLQDSVSDCNAALATICSSSSSLENSFNGGGGGKK